MTNRRPENATFLLMTTHTIRRLVLLSLLFPLSPLRAEEPALRDLLRDALYTEEVTRDPEKAAKQYEDLLARHAAQKTFAASALFRLAEVRRKQDRKDDATQLYQRLLAEFPNAETETKLARENLAALGAKAEVPAALPIDEESRFYRSLEKMAQDSPDHLRKPEIIAAVIAQAVEKGPAPVAFVLDHARSAESDELAMQLAARGGHLAVVEILLSRRIDPKGETAIDGLNAAVEAGNREIVSALLKAGTSPDGKRADAIPQHLTPLIIATRRGNVEIARILIEAGADVNLVPGNCLPNLENETDIAIGGPLHEAVWRNQPQIVDLLVEHKADVNLMEPVSKITPIWLAVRLDSAGTSDMVKHLLELGAAPDANSAPLPTPDEARSLGAPDDSSAHTPLELAVISGSVNCVKLLLAAKRERNTPVESKLLWDSVSNYSSMSTILEITRLLLDHGADPNPPDLCSQSMNRLSNEEIPVTQPMDSSLIRHAVINWTNQSPEEFVMLVELLLERGTKVNPDWIKEGFPDTPMGIRKFFVRRLSYPQWVEEKAIWMIDLTERLPNWKPVITAKGDEEPPMLESWMLDEESKTLHGFQKEFPEFALYRKTDKGVTEIAVVPLDSPEPFPKLQWGDILEIRGREGRAFATPALWSGVVRQALEKKVKASQPAPAPSPR